jgi:hypothetical protein
VRGTGRKQERAVACQDAIVQGRQMASVFTVLLVFSGCGAGGKTQASDAHAPKAMGAQCIHRGRVRIANGPKDIAWFTAARLSGRAQQPGTVFLISKRRRLITDVAYWDKPSGEPGPRWTLWAAKPFGYPDPREVPVEKLFQLPRGSAYVAYSNDPATAKRVFNCLDRLRRRLAREDRG